MEEQWAGVSQRAAAGASQSALADPCELATTQ